MFEELQHHLHSVVQYLPHPSVWVLLFIVFATAVAAAYLVDQKTDLTDPVEPAAPAVENVEKPQASNTTPSSD